MKKIGFIGMGNMARAIASGFVGSGAVAAGDIYAYAPHYDKLAKYCEPLGICACKSVNELLAEVDTVVMAVKPYVVENVLKEIHDQLADKAFLSVVAGYTLEKYRPLVPETTRVQYVMPNTPCMVSAGVLIFEEATTLTEEERETAMRMFRALGTMEVLPTHLMDAGTAVSGCGPAFVAMMLEAMADAGVKYGLPRETAYRMASQTAVGTGRMQLETEMLPAAIKDGVCSPGGTTIRGVEALEKHGMRYAFMQALKATIEG